MKICVVSICLNERTLMPFFLRHYDYADEVIIFDNGSTDGTQDVVNADGRCKLADFKTDGLRDDVHVTLKNHVWRKMTDADWIIAVDLDEFIWHDDVRGLLGEYDKNGITMPLVQGWHMVGDSVPKDGKLTDVIKSGARGIYDGNRKGLVHQHLYDKRAVFKRFIHPGFGPGCHFCRPAGNVKASQTAELKLLHYKFISLDYALEKTESMKLSKENKAAGWGYHVGKKDFMTRWYEELDKVKQTVIREGGTTCH